MNEIDELLAVPDMPEDEQYYWLCYHNTEYHYRISVFPDNNKEKRKEMAGLAFRLRDEVKELKYRSFDDTEGYALDYAWREVYEYVTHKKRDYGFRSWMIYERKAIHEIIVALRAKGLAKEKTDANRN